MSTFFKTVVTPLDGSELAELVLPHLPNIAPPNGVTVALAQVIEPGRYALGGLDFSVPTLLDILREGAREYLARQAESLHARGYRVTTHVLVGDPAFAILDLAEELHADLIAMTTHGRTGFMRLALGSVAERILQKASAPVLLVRERMDPARTTIKRILAPLDGSVLAEQALSPAQSLAHAHGATLILLRVSPILDEGGKQILFADEAAANAQIEQWRVDAETYLHELAAGLNRAGIPIETRVALGNPADVIYNTIDDAAVDVVVMGTHGRTGLKRWYFGSVADRVLRGAKCPVLMVRNLKTE
ncbi:MAG: universal stress protein [Caldilineaceae bacterium]|nr:universal stress protein [Caldilineaceae bacterium]